MAKRSGKLSTGKLPIEVLRRLLKKYAGGGRDLVVGPSIGIDSAVIDFHGRYLLAKTDPITFVAEDIGVYTIHINANDIAVMGGTPSWFLATILLPEGTPVKSVESIFAQLSRACRQIDVTLCGGHTEVTYGIDRPIVVGVMLGKVDKGKLITGGGAKAGDDIILTKGIAIEAVSVMARTHEKELSKAFPKSFIARCKNFIKRPGLSVLKDARAALRHGRVHAMHDPTEGGLATGLYEMAEASDCGILVDKEAIPVLPEAGKLCGHFGLDPLGSIASGALIISIDPRDTKKVLEGLKKEGVKAALIGKVTSKRDGVRIKEGKTIKILEFFERDEITKIF